MNANLFVCLLLVNPPLWLLLHMLAYLLVCVFVPIQACSIHVPAFILLVRLLSSQPSCFYACLLVCLSIVLPTHMTVYMLICLHAYFSHPFLLSAALCHHPSLHDCLHASLSLCLLWIHSCVLSLSTRMSVCLLAFCMSASVYLFCMHFCTIVCFYVNLSLCTFPWQ
jgi:hypothetical protein